jgi:hypothetical protein
MSSAAPMRVTVSCCWSYAHDTRGWRRAVKGVSLVRSHARRDGWMQLTASRRDRDFLKVILHQQFDLVGALAATDAQPVRRNRWDGWRAVPLGAAVGLPALGCLGGRFAEPLVRAQGPCGPVARPARPTWAAQQHDWNASRVGTAFAQRAPRWAAPLPCQLRTSLFMPTTFLPNPPRSCIFFVSTF